jgi:hypothetical protein
MTNRSKPLTFMIATVVGFASVAVSSASAQVTHYETFKTQQFSQFADAPPSGPINYYFYARIVGAGLPSYFTTASVLTPLAENLSLSFDGGSFIAFGFASSQADLDTRFPSGVYQYSISGGSLGSENANLTQTANLFPDAVPRVLNYDALQTLNVSSDFELQLNSYTTNPEINSPNVFVVVRDYFGGTTPFVDAFLNDRTTSVIPASTLVAGRLYVLTVYFSARHYDGSAAFGGSTVGPSFDYATDMFFTPTEACPCPADFDASGGTPDASDINAFFTAWLAGDPTADTDCSGGTPDATDIDVFFAAWLNGGC